jgi:hypothetical protein
MGLVSGRRGLAAGAVAAGALVVALAAPEFAAGAPQQGRVIDRAHAKSVGIEPVRRRDGTVRRRVETVTTRVTREVPPRSIGAPFRKLASHRCFVNRKAISKRVNRLPGGRLYTWVHEVQWCGRDGRVSWFRANRAYPTSTGIGVWHVRMNVRGNGPGGRYYIRAWAGSEFCEGIPQWACYHRQYPFHQARYYHGGGVADEITRS